MKQFLFVLLVLAIAVPAGATVLVYNMKETCTGLEFDYDEWWSYKDSWSGFFLIEQTGPETAEVYAIWTWKYGKQKYAEAEDWGEISFIFADFGKGKAAHVISGSDKESRFLFTGASKMKKVSAYKAASCDRCHGSDPVLPGDIAQTLPASLAGYLVCDYKEGDPFTYRDLWTSKYSLKLNVKYTIEGHLHNALDIYNAVDELLNVLEDQGYYIDW